MLTPRRRNLPRSRFPHGLRPWRRQPPSCPRRQPGAFRSMEFLASKLVSLKGAAVVVQDVHADLAESWVEDDFNANCKKFQNSLLWLKLCPRVRGRTPRSRRPSSSRRSLRRTASWCEERTGRTRVASADGLTRRWTMSHLMCWRASRTTRGVRPRSRQAQMPTRSPSDHRRSGRLKRAPDGCAPGDRRWVPHSCDAHVATAEWGHAQ